MSRIDDMIARLCPDGVEYKKLGEVGTVLRGKRLTKKQLSEDSGYPVYHGGVEPIGYYDESNRAANSVMVINVGASAGTVGFCREEFWSSDGCYCLALSEGIDSRYCYYALKSQERGIISKVRHAGIPTLDAGVLVKFEVPVPPLEIQREIVRVLDSFTDLEADLEAELEARKAQYAYYRDRLLSRESLEEMTGGEVALVSLDTCCNKILAGGDVPVGTEKGQIKPSDDKPYPVYSNGNAANSLYGYAPSFRVDSDAVTIAARGSIGFHAVRKAPFTPVVRLITLVPDTTILDVKYLNHALSQTAIEGDKGGIPQLTVPKVKKMSILLPPLSVQQQVVDILDRFDALTTSLTDGLPAEIEARRQQYEYYRDKLLDFPQKGASS